MLLFKRGAREQLSPLSEPHSMTAGDSDLQPNCFRTFLGSVSSERTSTLLLSPRYKLYRQYFILKSAKSAEFIFT